MCFSSAIKGAYQKKRGLFSLLLSSARYSNRIKGCSSGQEASLCKFALSAKKGVDFRRNCRKDERGERLFGKRREGTCFLCLFGTASLCVPSNTLENMGEHSWCSAHCQHASKTLSGPSDVISNSQTKKKTPQKKKNN